MLTDRDERALLAAAENRISEPLRIGAALASVRRALRRRPPVPATATTTTAPEQERESAACPPPPATPAPRVRPAQALHPIRPGLPTHR